MGRSNYNKHQNFVVQRGADGNRRVFTEHDDRDNAPPARSHPNRVWTRLGQKQVGFVDDGPRGGGIRKSNNRNRNIQNPSNFARGIIQDYDEDMGVRSEQGGRARPLPNRGRGQFRGGRARGPRPGPSRIPHRIGSDTMQKLFNWHKVTLRMGSKYDKMHLLRELAQKCEQPFRPLCYQKKGMNTEFWVEDQNVAKALKALDKTIELPDGPMLIINVDRSTPPNMPINEELVEKMKLIMSNRYNAENKALNLKAFHTDEGFIGDSFYAPLWRSNVLIKVMSIIGENIPEVTAVDLSDNKMLNLDNMQELVKKAPNINIVHLANNRLREAKTLEKLKGLKLIELKLEGNPFVERLEASYTSVIRKIFPTLQYLDGKALPKEIGFELDDDDADPALPPSIPKYIKHADAGSVVLKFLEQYYILYDGDSRQPLLDAYHEDAMMSMAAVGSFEQLKAYILESRNLTRISDNRQHKLLKRGRLQVVSFLSSLPKTKHDPTTFTLDVPFASEKLMTFTVTGMFKERGVKDDKVKHFNRSFIVVPHGQGFCIVNDVLFITFATTSNAKRAFSSPDAQLPAPGAASPAAPATAVATTSPQLDVAQKQAMAIAFAEKSRMNVEWSVKCLEENLWNFDKSAVVFAELNAAGKIPPEAFVK